MFWHRRKNKLDTPEELKAELIESASDIAANVDKYHYSLSRQTVEKLLTDLTSLEYEQLISKLPDIAPEQLTRFSGLLQKTYGSDVSKLKPIIAALALDGKIPEADLTPELMASLNSEIFTNDPLDVQQLNQAELLVNMLSLRYQVQEQLLHLYKHKHKSEPKFPIEFEDTRKPPEVEKLEEKVAATAETKSHLDDYVAEFKLGKKLRYEVEELIYLGKKALHYAKLEHKHLPEIEHELAEIISQHKHLLGYLNEEMTVQGQDGFSFHQVKLNGGVYNFAYFGRDAFQNEFHELPKLNNHQPVLILLHGMYLNWACWRWMLGVVASRFQVLIPDMNGYGDSDELIKYHNFENFSEYVETFINKLGIQEYNIMGHSAGGFTIQGLLSKPHSHHPKRAVLIASAPYLTIGKTYKQFVLFLNNLIRPQNSVRILIRGRKKVKWAFGIHSKIFPKSYLYDTLNKASLRTVTETIMHLITEYNLEDKKIETAAKVLVVYAAKDTRVQPESTKQLLRIIPGSKSLFIPHADHTDIIKIFPLEYKQQLLEFLNS